VCKKNGRASRTPHPFIEMLLVVPLAITVPGMLKRFKSLDVQTPEKVHFRNRFTDLPNLGILDSTNCEMDGLVP